MSCGQQEKAIHVPSVLPQKLKKVPRDFLNRLNSGKQPTDQGNRIGPSIDHTPCILPCNATNRNDGFGSQGPRPAHSIKTNHRFCIQLGAGGKDRPDGYVISTTQVGQPDLLIIMRRYADPSLQANHPARIPRQQIALPHMNAVPSSQKCQIGAIVENHPALSPGEDLANDSSIPKHRLWRASFIAILQQFYPGGPHLLGCPLRLYPTGG